MRTLMTVVAVVAACFIGTRTASAGHYEGWSAAERAEHDQRAAEVAPAPAPEPCPETLVTREAVRENQWRIGADEYDDSQSNPLRILAYLIHPVGYSLEWLVTRPFHEVVAQPDLEPVFGHDDHAYYGESPFGVSTTRGSYQSLRY